MLQTLENFHPEEKAVILSDVALSLLPDPGINQNTNISPRIEKMLIDEILAEVRCDNHIELDDNSDTAMAVIFSALAKEITKVTIGYEKRKSVERLFQNGLLKPDSTLEVNIHQEIKEWLLCYGIRQNHVIDAIQSPTEIHFVRTPEGFSKTQSLCLFAKLIVSKNKTKPVGSDDFVLLVWARWHDYTIDVECAFRAYLSDLNMERISATRIWENFYEKYGLEFNVCGKSTKFQLFKILSDIDVHSQGKVRIFEIDAPEDGANTIISLNEYTRVAIISFAFALNVKKYIKMLHTHNVSIDPNIEQHVVVGEATVDLITGESPYLSVKPPGMYIRE